MSRSGYSDDCDSEWDWIRWRGVVKSALRGKRGQAFLQEMLEAMAALPTPELIAGELQSETGAFCAIGSVGKARGMDMSEIHPEDYEAVAAKFGIAPAMAQEIVYMNDEAYWRETTVERFQRMRRWIESELYVSPIRK